MPARAKGRSEYKSHFKWLESFRGKEFKPAPEQMAPPAGKGSVFSSLDVEPAIQHKKRVEGPPTSLSVNFEEGYSRSYDDFALLGQQHKFASNVRYGLKPSKGDKLQGKEKDLSHYNSKELPPPPKQMKIEESQTRARRRVDVSEGKSRKESGKENLTPTSPPPAPRKARRDDIQEIKEGLRDKNLSDVLPKKKAAAKNKMNETVQTDMGKGVALSAQEAPADYSLKYKAGIAPARVSRKASEYQKQYEWKKGIPASPLLSAEQIVYNSNAQMSPPKKAPVFKTSEYQAQFKTYNAQKDVPLVPKPSQEPHNLRGRKRTQVKRSKSVGATLSPDRMVAAGSAPVTSADDPRLLRQSRDSSPVRKLPVQHGTLKRVVSEYRSNFKPPTGFNYEGGAWKDAFPPQLLQNKNNNAEEKPDAEAEEAAPLANWFAEVIELRRRANEYKRRAQGTHFSREHLVQLLAKQSGCWDVDSARSSAASSLDALALEPTKAPVELPERTKQNQRAAKMSLDKMSHVAVKGDSPEPSVNGNRNNNAVKRTRKGRSSKRTKMAWQEESAPEEREELAPQQESSQSAACQADLQEEEYQDIDEAETEEQGRLPTPVLRQQRERASRHHLDLTTPSVGGILLSVPGQQLSERSDGTDQTVSEMQSSPKLKFTTEKLATSPLLGKPTPDTHALRDEEAESDRVMETRYLASPPKPVGKAERNSKAVQRKMNAKIPSTIDERMGQTYNKDVGNFHVEDLPLGGSVTADDDALSVSAMSIASSCSLASEVYERARRRRDEFWGKPRQ